jgi:hypothetical protein
LRRLCTSAFSDSGVLPQLSYIKDGGVLRHSDSRYAFRQASVRAGTVTAEALRKPLTAATLFFCLHQRRMRRFVSSLKPIKTAAYDMYAVGLTALTAESVMWYRSTECRVYIGAYSSQWQPSEAGSTPEAPSLILKRCRQQLNY